MNDRHRSIVDSDRDEARSIRQQSLATRYEMRHGMTRDEIRAEVGDES